MSPSAAFTFTMLDADFHADASLRLIGVTDNGPARRDCKPLWGAVDSGAGGSPN